MTFRIYSNSVISASKGMRHSREAIYQQMEDTDAWLLGILYQGEADSKTKKSYCEICNYAGPPGNLELDHIAGRKHDSRTITVCKINDRDGCHAIRTRQQRLWGPRWLEDDLPVYEREQFMLRGLRDILLLKAEKTGNWYCRLIADEFIEDIYEHSKIKPKKEVG